MTAAFTLQTRPLSRPWLISPKTKSTLEARKTMLSRLLGALTAKNTAPKPASRIAFDRINSNVHSLQNGVFTIGPDGSDCRHIRSSGKEPVWSPNGRKIAFREETEDDGWLSSIFEMTPDGGNVRRLTFHKGYSAEMPSWSPDSNYLVYSLWLHEDYRYQIYRLDTRGGPPVPLTDGGDSADPVWTPSNEIVYHFSAEPRSDRQLYVMSLDGQHKRECRLFEPDDYAPAWSHDGRVVLFRRDNDAFVCSPDGSGLCQVPINRASGVAQIVISPDGRSVAFSECNSFVTGYEIYVLPLDGTPERKLVANPLGEKQEAHSYGVSWSPFL